MLREGKGYKPGDNQIDFKLLMTCWTWESLELRQ